LKNIEKILNPLISPKIIKCCLIMEYFLKVFESLVFFKKRQVQKNSYLNIVFTIFHLRSLSTSLISLVVALIILFYFFVKRINLLILGLVFDLITSLELPLI